MLPDLRKNPSEKLSIFGIVFPNWIHNTGNLKMRPQNESRQIQRLTISLYNSCSLTCKTYKTFKTYQTSKICKTFKHIRHIRWVKQVRHSRHVRYAGYVKQIW